MAKRRYQELLYQVGSALHSWSLVEMDLARLFGHLSSMRGSQDLFGTVISFETRLAMCDRLIELSALDPEEIIIWRKLSARLSKYYKKRHEIAHFTLGQDGEKEVIFPFLTTATIRSPNKRKLTAEQIDERNNKFSELQDALKWFAKVAVRRRMPKQSPSLSPLEEPPLVARLRELATQTLVERERPGPTPLG